MTFQSISAITLAVKHMAIAFAFYHALGLELVYGGPEAVFSSFRVGEGFLNLLVVPGYTGRWWGRAILWVDDVDAVYTRALAGGLAPHASPSDAPWGERFFHITDPDGHEISIARPLKRR
jgi:catechol 2,3-dioxygenase-like lactoylglutathione lyase family enzyme